MNVVTWDPFNNLNQMFNRHARYAQNERSESKPDNWSPLVDIYEAADKFMLRAELPGVDKEGVSVSIDENVLTLKGEKSFVDAKEGEQWKRVETQYGEFKRSFTLPEDIDADNVSATYKDGVLELSIPKIEPVKPKTVAVKIH